MKIHIFKQLTSSCLGLLCLLPSVTQGQTQLNGLKHSTTYQEKIETYFLLPESVDMQLLPPIDKVSIQGYNEENLVVRAIDSNNDFTTTVTHLSSDRYGAWDKKPGRTVITRDAVKLYDQNNNLASDLPSIPQALAQYDMMKAEIAANGIAPNQTFPAMGIAQIQSLSQQGANVTMLSNGAVQIDKDGIRNLYDAANKRTEWAKVENNKVVFSISKLYTVIDGKSIPTQRIEMEQVTLGGGVCAQKITKTTFSKYVRLDKTGNNQPRIGQNSNTAEAAAQIESARLPADATPGSSKILLFPNPAETNLFVQLPSYEDADAAVLVALTDVFGQVVMQKAGQKGGQLVAFDIGSLQGGIYFVRTESGGKSDIQRFVKK